MSSPNLPTAGLATCKLNLLCSGPQSYLPLSNLSPSLPSSVHICSPLLGQKIPTQLVPYSLALERTGKLGSRQRNKQTWGHRCHWFTWHRLAKLHNWYNSFLAHHSLFDVPGPELTVNSIILIPGTGGSGVELGDGVL